MQRKYSIEVAACSLVYLVLMFVLNKTCTRPVSSRRVTLSVTCNCLHILWTCQKSGSKISTTCKHLLLSERLLQPWLENYQQEKKKIDHHFKNSTNEMSSHKKSIWRWIRVVWVRISEITSLLDYSLAWLVTTEINRNFVLYITKVRNQLLSTFLLQASLMLGVSRGPVIHRRIKEGYNLPS